MNQTREILLFNISEFIFLGQRGRRRGALVRLVFIKGGRTRGIAIISASIFFHKIIVVRWGGLGVSVTSAWRSGTRHVRELGAGTTRLDLHVAGSGTDQPKQ